MFSQSREKQISPKEFRGLGGLGPSAQGSRMSFHSSGTGEDTVYPNDQLLILHLRMNSLCEERPRLTLAECSYELITGI